MKTLRLEIFLFPSHFLVNEFLSSLVYNLYKVRLSMKIGVIALVIINLIFFFLIFISVPWITGNLTGWKNLSKTYAYLGPIPTSKIWRHCSVPNLTMRNFLTVALNEQGMYFEMPMWFRNGNPPLFLPWSRISVIDSSLFGKKTMKFSFQRSETTFHFYSVQAEEFKMAAGSFWPKGSSTN